MQIRTTSNVAEVAREWKRLKRDYEKTLIDGVNKTAFRIRKNEMPRIMEEGIDRPVSFTKNVKATVVDKATVNNPTASIRVQDIQAEYLQGIVFGARGQRGKAVPVGIRLNKFGNINKLRDQQRVKTELAKPNVFAATFGGVSGIFQRQARGLKMLIYFSKGDYKYRKQFDWHKSVRKRVDVVLPKAMNEVINKTIKRYAARAAR